MRNSEQKYIGLILLIGFLAAIGTIGFLFARGDFKVVVIETDATLENEHVGEFVNLADSQYTYEYFQEASAETKTAVLVGSRWCGICNVLKTTMQNECSEQAQEPINLMEADIDINLGIVRDYSISTVPTILLVEGDEYSIHETPNLEEVELLITNFLQE